MGMLNVSLRQVNADTGEESYDKAEGWMTLIDCTSTEAARDLAEKLPAPGKS